MHNIILGFQKLILTKSYKLFIYKKYINLLGIVRGPCVLIAKQVGAGTTLGRGFQNIADWLSCLANWGTKVYKLRHALTDEAHEIDVPGLRQPVYLRKNGTDHRTFYHVFLKGDYDVRLDASSVSVIVDGGANIGLSSLYFNRKFPGAHIIAVEPDNDNFEQLSKNVRGYSNITAIRGALWGSIADVHIANPNAAAWSFRVEEQSVKSTTSLGALTIAQIMNDYKIEYIDLLKLDVEGAEKNIFGPDCDAWLNKTRLIICELHDRFLPGCSSRFHDAVQRNGFDLIYCGENVIAEKVIVKKQYSEHVKVL